MKKFAWKKCRKMFLEALFFAFEKNFFRVSVQDFGHCRLHEIIGLQLSQCLSANHNRELRCVICTGVTLFALVLRFLRWCYIFCAGVTLELHCSQPIRMEQFFHVYYYKCKLYMSSTVLCRFSCENSNIFELGKSQIATHFQMIVNIGGKIQNWLKLRVSRLNCISSVFVLCLPFLCLQNSTFLADYKEINCLNMPITYYNKLLTSSLMINDSNNGCQ